MLKLSITLQMLMCCKSDVKKVNVKSVIFITFEQYVLDHI